MSEPSFSDGSETPRQEPTPEGLSHSSMIPDTEMREPPVIGQAIVGLIQDARIDPTTVSEVLRYIEEGSQYSQADLDHWDAKHSEDAKAELLETWGGDEAKYGANIEALRTLVEGLPKSARDAILHGRTADGRAILNNPALVQQLLGVALQPGPKGGDGKSIKLQLAEISDFRRDNRDKYFRDESMQKRERELIAMDMANGKYN
jgi:hypothetical protein